MRFPRPISPVRKRGQRRASPYNNARGKTVRGFAAYLDLCEAGEYLTEQMSRQLAMFTKTDTNSRQHPPITNRWRPWQSLIYSPVFCKVRCPPQRATTEYNRDMGVIDNRFERSYVLSTVDYVFNWARKSAIWPLTFGLACCAIEMIASTTSRFDIARFGAEVFRPSPRQADLMIVAGTVTLKMSPVLKRVWEQMPDPKWCISMGACSSVGGPFNVYSVLQGVDRIVPVDVYVIGCPPRPEGLFYALLKLQDKIDQMTLAKRPTEVRLQPRMVEDFKRGVMVAQTPEPR
jgi:NADH-quinone oxidoreductase subunit B